jgi:hypothetical protein
MMPLGIPGSNQPWEHDICPGYYVSQPQILEAIEAVDAFKNGCLKSYFPFQSNPALQAARELNSSFARFEAKRMKEAQDKR